MKEGWVSPEFRFWGYTPVVFQRVWKLLILGRILEAVFEECGRL